RQSTKTRDKKAASQIEAAQRIRLARVKAGLEAAEPAPDREEASASVPTLTEFAPEFREHIKLRCAEKPETIRFYNSKLDRLLEFAPLASRPLDAIDDTLVERYVTHRVNKKLAPATVNRELATLRR